MRILLTNDDGIDAPGIRALHAALTATDEDGNTVEIDAGALNIDLGAIRGMLAGGRPAPTPLCCASTWAAWSPATKFASSTCARARRAR